MRVTPSGIVTLVRLLQYSKAPFPMLVTLEGIVTLVRSLQYSKAEFPILVMPSGITKSKTSSLFKKMCLGSELHVKGLLEYCGKFVNQALIFVNLSSESLLQYWKALRPMLVTLEGIVTLVRLLQPEKAEPSMLVTCSPIVTDFKAVLHSHVRYPGEMSASQSMASTFEHPLKAVFSMLVMLDGIATLVKLLQFWKARSPMLVTPSSIFTLVRLLQ